MSNLLFSSLLKNKLVSGGIFILLSTVLNRLIIYSLIPVYTAELTTEQYGLIGYYQAILQLMQMVLGLGLYTTQLSLYYDYNKNPRQLGSFLYTINVTVAAVMLLSSGILLLGLELYGHLLPVSSQELFILKLLPWISLVQVMNLSNNTFRIITQQYKLLFVQKITESVCIALAVLYFLYFRGQQATADFLGNLAGSALSLLIFYPGYAGKFSRQFSLQQLKAALGLGIPMILHSAANLLVNIGDRFLIKYFLSVSSLGVYTFSYQIGQIMSVVMTAFNQSWVSYVFKTKNERPEKDFNRQASLIVISGCIFGLLLLLMSDLAIRYLINPEYQKAAIIIPVIIAGYLTNYFNYFANTLIVYYKKNKLLALITFLALIINIVLNIFLLPVFDIMGAAIATLLTIIIRGAISCIYIQQLDKHHLRISRLVVLLTPAVALCLGLGYVPQLIWLKSAAMLLFITGYSILLYHTWTRKTSP